jgi:hypothetical protein
MLILGCASSHACDLANNGCEGKDGATRRKGDYQVKPELQRKLIAGAHPITMF